ncbi:predicted protein [Naegleria gruberi]|uniref:Predicted protein n=1 Tax=Naegleria gruberi TaxID=5762 RepID=D2VBR7_NAEGR|nr:uncharacterized protein NAEGRDRAFT_79342 [Naegleria gruberi]EFC45954.1 predicted protein [Naegleria gruberi]|eukprot:XP_002678698.1 predicted protein [Naegleria gruberi strain NEG-M]
MFQLFEFDEDLNQQQVSTNHQWSTTTNKTSTINSFSSLPEDLWIEIFSFFPTSEKLLNLILISKQLQSPIYKSIKSLKLLGIDNNTTTTSCNNNNTVNRVAYSEDDKWLMSPISTYNKPALRNLSYASRMSTMRRLNKLNNTNNNTNNTTNNNSMSNTNTNTTTRLHSSSVPSSLNDLYYQPEEEEEINPLIKLLTPFSKITELSLEFCKALDSKTLCKILEKFTHLEILTIIHCSSLYSIKIEYPMQVCKNLKRLEIRDCRSIQECSGGIKLDCYLLEHLNITSTPCINERFISNLIDRNSNTLKTINLFNLLDFSNISISKKMINLNKINLQRCKNFKQFHLPIKQVCNVLPKLEELDLSYTNINDDSIKSLTNEQKLDQLKELKLENCKNLIKPIIGNCQMLTSISFDFCSYLEDVNIPSNNCPSLDKLSLNYTKINDKSIERIFNLPQPFIGFNELKTPPPITKLSAKKCKLIYNPKITSYSLEDLDLHGCYNISSLSLIDLSKKSLKRVNLGWTKIDDDNLTKIVETCPSIRELSVNTCDNLINPTIQSNSLQFISFQGAHHLQNPILKCSSLKHVDLRNCDNLESPTLIKRKKKKIHHFSSFNLNDNNLNDNLNENRNDDNIYQVRRRLNFDDFIDSSTLVDSNIIGNSTNDINDDIKAQQDEPTTFNRHLNI